MKTATSRFHPLTDPRTLLVAVLCTTTLFACGRIGGRGRAAIGGDLYGLEEPRRMEAGQWLPAWTGRWVGGRLELERVGSSYPRGAELTLGLAAARPSTASAQAGEDTGSELGRAMLDIQNQGSVVRGVHLWLESPSGDPTAELAGLEDLARWLGEVRSTLGDDFELSWTVPWLDPDAITAEMVGLRRTVDWFVVRTYGQAGDAVDEDSLWDLAGAERRLEAAAASEQSFRSLIRVGGSIGQRSDRGVTMLATHLPCDAFEDLAGLSESFFQFEGYFRQVFEADPRLRVLRIGEREISVGDRLRVNRTTVDHLRTLLGRIESLDLEGHLGHLFLDVAVDPQDCLGLDLEELALATGPPARLPELSMEELGRDRYRLRIRGGSETTGLARAKHNYVDVIADEGTILDVDMSGFVRFEFIDRQREPAPGLLGVGVRLHLPLLEAGRTAEAVIQTRAHRTGFLLGPRFLSPTGPPLPLEDERWPDGSDPVAPATVGG